MEHHPGAVIRRSGTSNGAHAAAAVATHAEPDIAPVAVTQEVPTVTDIDTVRIVEQPTKPKKVKTPKAPKVREPKPAKPAKPQKVKTPKAPKVREPKPGRSLKLTPGENVEYSTTGWSGIFRATLLITTYRIAVRRLGRTRWIPLEEVRKASRMRGGLVVEASIEHFRFRGRDVEKAFDALDVALYEARRPNSRRHDADVLQTWCDRCEIWDSHTGRIRLWLNRHPVLVLALFTTAVVAIRVYVTPH